MILFTPDFKWTGHNLYQPGLIALQGQPGSLYIRASNIPRQDLSQNASAQYKMYSLSDLYNFHLQPVHNIGFLNAIKCIHKIHLETGRPGATLSSYFAGNAHHRHGVRGGS